MTSDDGVYSIQQDAANDLLDTLLQQTIGYGKNSISSLNEYISYRDELIDTIANDETIKIALADGFLSEDSIASSVDAYLGTLEKFEDYYNNWYDLVASDTANGIQNIIDEFATNLSEEDSDGKSIEDQLHDFEKWIDSLTLNKREIVYKISCDTETAEWTLSDWQSALDNYEIPEEDKISFSELIRDPTNGSENQFVKQINAYKDKISKLDEVYKSYANNDFDPTELFLEFPELAAYSDDLGAAILELKEKLTGGEDALGNFTGIYKVFRDQFGKLKTADDIVALTNLMNAVMGLKIDMDSVLSVQQLSTGFDQLGKIYLDVLNKEDFDFASVLDDENFKSSFGNLGDAYEDFIKVITNSPSDIDACQEAFNNLAAKYIDKSNALSNLTDENKEIVSAMLKQMGVANASVIVDRALAIQKERLALRTGELADKEYDEIYSLYEEAEAGSTTKQVLAELAAEKYLVNENGIRTSSDIDQLIALANSANATTATLGRLAKAKSLIAQADAEREKAAASSGFLKRSLHSVIATSYEKEAQRLINEGLDYDEIDASDFKVDYTGGYKTNKAVSSSGSSKSKSSNEDNAKSFDWIEVAIDRIERAVDRLKTTATSAYKALKTKLGATYDEISKVNEEIAVHGLAYERYMEEANSVGLSSDLASKVQDGTIDLTEYDSETQELIKDYQEWYEKALDCSDAIQQLHEDLASLYEDNFNNIKDDFDSQLELLEHMTTTYETGIDKLEAQGYLQSTEYYAALKDVEQKNIAVLNQELASLTQSFSEAMASGEIDEESEAWYGMQSSINEVKEAIDEAELSLAKYAQTMREVEWEHFDYTRERIAQVTQESDFMIELMSNSDMHTDNGQLTD